LTCGQVTVRICTNEELNSHTLQVATILLSTYTKHVDIRSHGNNYCVITINQSYQTWVDAIFVYYPDKG